MLNVKLSIIIPVYNEINTFLKILELVQKEPHSKEIIIVDDASTDGTKELIQKINDSNIKTIFHKTNMGKGACLRSAQGSITGDIVIIQDADLEYYPDEYGVLIQPIAAGKADVVYGTRFSGVHRIFHFYHYIGNAVINLIANFLLNTTLSDLMTGYKAFNASVFKSITMQAGGFGIEPEITAEVFKKRYKVYEVPISYQGRAYDEGKKIRWFHFFVCLYWLIRAKLRSVDVYEEALLRMQSMANNNQWVYDKMKPYLGSNILEIGSGIGTVSSRLLDKERVLTLTDVNDNYIAYLEKKFIGNPYVEVIKNNIIQLSETIKNKKIDTVVCINVLEHIENDMQALINMKEYLTENGRLIIMVPAHKVLYSLIDKTVGHNTRYTISELAEKIKNAGFRICRQEYMNAPGAIGWFFVHKLFKKKHMSVLTIRLFDKFIPLISTLEKFFKMPFGLSVYIIAEKNSLKDKNIS